MPQKPITLLTSVLFGTFLVLKGPFLISQAFSDVFTGTDGDDTIKGTNKDDEIYSGAGSYS